MNCNKCGNVVRTDDLFCSNCGNKLDCVNDLTNIQLNNNQSYQYNQFQNDQQVSNFNQQVSINNGMQYSQPKSTKVKFPVFRILLPFLLSVILNLIKFVITILTENEFHFLGALATISILVFFPNIIVQVVLWDNKRNKAINNQLDMR